MASITFYIVRHGKTVMNELDLVQGWCDSPLTDKGAKDASDLGRGLKHIPFHAAYCSTLNRTKQTAELILKAKDEQHLPISQIEGLKEASFGMFEAELNSLMWGKAAEKLGCSSADDLFKQISQKKISMKSVLNIIKEMDTTDIAEDFATLADRTSKALKKIAKKEIVSGEAKNILVVSHGISIFSLLIALGGEEMLTEPILNTSVSKVIFDTNKFTIESIADLSYLENGRQ